MHLNRIIYLKFASKEFLIDFLLHKIFTDKINWEKQKNLQVAKLEDYVTFRGSIDDDFVNESLSNFINDYVKIKPYDREYPIHEWKHKIRKVLLVVSGYNKIEFLKGLLFIFI